jgi:hypothetical protein
MFSNSFQINGLKIRHSKRTNMLEILKETGGDLIATRVSGTIEATDMEKVLPLLKNAIKIYGHVSWYYEMADLEGWTLRGFWTDFSFDITHANSFKRIAMVGDKQWEKLLSEMMKPFTAAEVKYFDLSEREAAMRWIKSL